MKKRSLCILLAICSALLFLLGGCGSNTASEKEVALISDPENPVQLGEDGRNTAAELGITKPDRIVCYRDKKSVAFTAEDAEFAALETVYALVKDQRLSQVKTIYSLCSDTVGESGDWIVFTYDDSDKKMYFSLAPKENPNDNNLIFIMNSPGVRSGSCYAYDGGVSDIDLDLYF